MHLYLISWAAAFVALLLAIVITAWIYRLMGDGLDLNGSFQEISVALIVSAGQAGGYVLQQHFPLPPSYMLRSRYSVAASAFVLCLWLGYKITHLTSWDRLEYVILGLVDASLASLAV